MKILKELTEKHNIWLGKERITAFLTKRYVKRLEDNVY